MLKKFLGYAMEAAAASALHPFHGSILMLIVCGSLIAFDLQFLSGSLAVFWITEIFKKSTLKW